MVSFYFYQKIKEKKKRLIDKIKKIKLVNFDFDEEGTKVIYG